MKFEIRINLRWATYVARLVAFFLVGYMVMEWLR